MWVIKERSLIALCIHYIDNERIVTRYLNTLKILIKCAGEILRLHSFELRKLSMRPSYEFSVYVGVLTCVL
jgi:hypothetical protein